MLDSLTCAAFEPLVGKRFGTCVVEGQAVEIELIQAQALPVFPGRGPGIRQQPFTLTFRGPRELILPQRTYALEQGVLGIVEIFLVPIGPDEIGQRYEAVFN